MLSAEMSDRTLRIALVEPYLGGSHRAWAEGYQRHSMHDVEVFGLPAIHWKWRMQGGHVTLAGRIEAAVVERGPFDVVLASSMTDLARLVGIARRSLGVARLVLYMHENQLTFPRPGHDPEDLTYAMTNWTSMVAADLVVFNSAYHRDEWFSALAGFLGRLPDHRHTRLIDAVVERSVVLPVGADLRALDALERVAAERPLVLWNQRWQHDKGPAEFVAAIEALVTAGHEFDVALAGERPGDDPPELRRLRSVLGERLVHDGHADLDAYRRLLRRADVVVSTAHHEFFGVAITEAIAAGAFPVLPNRLVYPERIPDEHHPACLYDTHPELVERLAWAIAHGPERVRVTAALRPVMARCDWSEVAAQYDATLRSVTGRGWP
jgi:glycosyltransferase involved in cell wall biosynthesis